MSTTALVIAGNPVDILQVKADSLPALAGQITINNQESAELAGRFLQHLAARRKERVAHHAEVKRKADEAHKAACAAERADLAPLDQARDIVGPRVQAYLQECERQRLIAEAEARRIAREQQEAAERAAREAERIAREQAEQENQKAALEAIADGASIEEAEAIASAPVVVAPVVVPVVMAIPVAAPPKIAGVSAPKKWRAVCEDKLAALKDIIATWPAYSHIVDINQSQLDRTADAQKQLFKLAGCRAFPDAGLRVRG
jgi:hypothetical protein